MSDRLYGYIPTTQTLLGIIPVGSLTGDQLVRLMAQPLPHERPTPPLLKKASAVEKAFSSGNSTIWTGTATQQEIVRCRIDAHQWKDSGVLQIFVSGRFTNSTGAGTETVTFDLSVAAVPANNPGDSLLGQVIVPTSKCTWTTPAMAAAAGTGLFGMQINVMGEGQQASVWSQLLAGSSSQSILGGSTMLPGTYAKTLAIDPTVDFDVFLSFKHDATPNGTTKSFNVWSAHMGLVFPAEGSAR